MKLIDKTAVYFSKTVNISKTKLPNKIVTLQFFQRHDDVKLCGINEVIELLKTHTNTENYTIRYLPEGSIINSKEVVLELEGHYWEFGVWEGMIDGILARNTSIATNAYRIVREAKGKFVVSMADRADHYRNQEADAYAIEVGGILDHATLAASSYNPQHAWGSMPHALIQMCEGDIVEACSYYHELYPNDGLAALVDFHNDVIGDSLKVLDKFKDTLKSVRVDTSKGVMDHMFDRSENEYGVTPNQIKRLRKALDENGGKHVKIIVSSGFDAKKIKWFEDQKAPVDIYGVGAALEKIDIHFSADATKVDGKLCAKEGRGYSYNSKLIEL